MLTAAGIEKFSMGGDTSASAKITKEQAFTTAGTKLIEIRDVESGYIRGRYVITVACNTPGQTVTAPPGAGQNEMFKPQPRIAGGFWIKSLPQKTTFKVGESFDVTGVSAVYNTKGETRADDKSTPVTDKLTYRYSEDGVKFIVLKPGWPIPFTSAGRYLIEIQYEGITEEIYTVAVT